ncbi:MAG: hypothetical protein AABX04_01305 [Nanoarchaeota archaeon]
MGVSRSKFNFMRWIPLGFSITLVLTWLIILLVVGLGQYLTAGIMVLVILILTTLIAWKNAPIGGGIFIILGAGYMIFSMSMIFSVAYILAAFPLFITGSAFIIQYLYLERKEQEEEGVDDF